MTPAINLAKKKKNRSYGGISITNDANNTNYGLEAVEALGQDPKRVFKTLLFCLNGVAKDLAVAVIPVDQKLIWKPWRPKRQKVKKQRWPTQILLRKRQVM